MKNVNIVYVVMLSIALLLISMSFLFATETKAAKKTRMTSEKENTLYLQLKDGTVEIELYPNKAPKTVARIKELADKGFYDGIIFHRVIDGFMAQTGDPTGTGMSGSGTKLNAEFNDLSHDRGVISMARAMDVNSADSQFFICLAPAKFLDGQYTAFGKVVEGMKFVDAIAKGEPPAKPDKIIKMRTGKAN
jgi:peptidylprolyl isomerase